MPRQTDFSSRPARRSVTPAALSEQSIRRVSTGIATPAYDRNSCRTGIVHLGPGAFHRAHQAVYIDDVLAQGETDWALCGVSLHSRKVRQALAPQNYLYTLAILDDVVRFRIIGSIRELLVASQQAETVIQRLTDPATRLVTLTVTEKGYCLTPSGDLDDRHPDIRHELLASGAPTTAIGFVVEGLRRRHAANTTPFTVLSCDNLTDNGKRLARAVIQFAGLLDPALARWIENEVLFPNSMVDNITPATDDSLRSRVEQATGLRDAWPIQREAFSQWVVEDRFTCGRPQWQNAGVTMANDVGPYEQAKLRLLNGAHSTMAYLGILSGYQTVADVAANAGFIRHIKMMMHTEIKPGLAVMQLDVDEYIDSILSRFGNATIRHQLSQIAWDGSQKLPFRILGTVRDNLSQGRSIERLCLTVAAWFHFVRRRLSDDIDIVDPLAPTLQRIGRACTGDAKADIALFGALDTVFEACLYSDPHFHRQLCQSYEMIETRGAAGALAQMLKRP